MSCDDNKTAIIWDVESGREIKIIDGCQSDITPASFSSEYIVFGYYNIIKLMEFKPLDKLIKETRERFKDNPLTPEERRDYYIE